MIQLIFFPSIFRMYNQGKKTVIRMLGKYNPSDNKHSSRSFFVSSCCCCRVFHLLDPISQSAFDVRCCDSLQRMDRGAAAGNLCLSKHFVCVIVTLSQAQHVLFMVSGVFYYFNSILNPILYAIMAKRCRRGFNDMTGSCSAFWVRE